MPIKPIETESQNNISFQQLSCIIIERRTNETRARYCYYAVIKRSTESGPAEKRGTRNLSAQTYGKARVTKRFWLSGKCGVRGVRGAESGKRGVWRMPKKIHAIKNLKKRDQCAYKLLRINDSNDFLI